MTSQSNTDITIKNTKNCEHHLSCINNYYTKEIYDFFFYVEKSFNINNHTYYNIHTIYNTNSDNSQYPSLNIVKFNPFYFIRHGTTNWSKNLLQYGKINLPLNDLGKKEALKASLILASLNIDIIISSPLYRTLEMSYIV